MILARLKIGDDFFGNLCEIPAIDVIVRLQKDGTEAGLSDRVVFEVKLVEAMKGVRVSLEQYKMVIITTYA